MIEILLVSCILLFVIVLTRINSQARHVNAKLHEFEKILKQHARSEVPPVRQPEALVEKIISRERTVFNPEEVDMPLNGSMFEEARQEPVKKETAVERPLVRELRPEPVMEDSWWEKFKTRNPDLEKFIGENLISKIGIAILVLGIAFFVKFAIDKNWINETMRVGIGILCGALVNFVAHRLRSQFKAFSSVLVAGAIAIYYFTIAIAFQEYHLFSQGVAFALMIVITAFSLLVSISYNRQELAILSLVGGFATPLMVSTGAGNYVVLFSYLLILDIGILVLAYLRKWNAVNVCTFVFTLLFYTSWFFTRVYGESNAPYGGALLFATLFYLVFTAMILINDIKEKRASGNLELALFIVNTGFYYAIGMYLIHLRFPAYEGLYTASMAVFNMAIGWILYKYFRADKKLVYLLVGLALTFTTLAAPVQLEGNHITLFWAAESVLLLWLSLKSELRNFLYSSVIVSVLMVGSLLIDWFQYYTGMVHAKLPVVFNALFMTGLFSCLCLFAKMLLLKRHPGVSFSLLRFDPAEYQGWLRGIGLVLLYFVCQIELSFQVRKFVAADLSANIVLGAFHMLYCTILTVYFYHARDKKMMTAAYFTSVINIVLFAVILSSMHMLEINHAVASLASTAAGFRIHFLSLACAAVMLYYLYRILAFHDGQVKANVRFMSWVFACAVVYICSIELLLSFSTWKVRQVWLDSSAHITFPAFYQFQVAVIKTGFPILWSLLSILFLIYGIRRQNKSMRLCSLVLQALTILKLFTYDINNVSEAGKIIAFIILGVILLIMSFMYQKIKAIIFNDEVPGT